MKSKNIILVFIALLLLTSFTYAKVTFYDVTTSYWAYNYIDFTAEKGIIKGFPDGTFMPADPVTKEQSLAMIYRSMEAASLLKSTENYTEEYLDVLNENHISEWARVYVAYALEYDLITEDELKSFIYSDFDLGLPASRQEVAVWSAKAVDKSLSPLYAVNYLDKDSINKEAVPYIDLLYRHGVMIGDDTNNFRPSSTITRAEFAAICSRVYNLGTSTQYDIAKEGYTFSGTIKDIDDNRIYFIDQLGIEKTLIISEDAGIIINGEESSLNRIKDNTQAMIGFNNAVDNNNVIIWTEEVIYKGYIEEKEKLTENTYKLTIENMNGQIISYILDNNSEVYDENHKEITLNSLTSGDKVKYTCDGIKILEIQIQ